MALQVRLKAIASIRSLGSSIERAWVRLLAGHRGRTLLIGVADRWMLKELVFASAVATLVMSGPVILISLYTNLPGEALYSELLWPSLSSIAPMILYHTLPVLAAVAIIWCYGKFSSDGTLVALHVAGRSNLSVRAPALLVAAGATVLGYLLSSVIAPHTAQHLHDVLYSIRHNLTPALLKAGKFNAFDRKGDVIYFERRVGHNKFSNVFILRKAVEGEERAYAAKHAVFEQNGEEQFVVLLDGSVQVLPESKSEVKVVGFENMVLPMAKSASAARGYRTVDELDTVRFLRERESALRDPVRATSWMREAMNRFVIPGMVLTHTLLGLELLAISGVLTARKREPIALICAGIAFIHFVAVLAVEQVGVNVHWAWAVAAVLAAELVVAAFLMLRRSGKIARFA